MCEALGCHRADVKTRPDAEHYAGWAKTGEYREVTAAERQKLEDILNGKKNV
ncbi:MAG: hypothetical protein ACLR8P_15875 [Clostridium fessum]